MIARIELITGEKRRGRRLYLEKETIYGATFLHARVCWDERRSPAWRRRMMRRLAREIARAGARRVLFPQDPDWRTALAAQRLIPVSPARLWAALAAPLALRGLREEAGLPPEESAVRLCSSRMNGRLWSAAVALAPQVRHLIVAVEDAGGVRLRDALRCRFGIADTARGAPDYTLAFAPLPPERGGPCPGFFFSPDPGRDTETMWSDAAELSCPGLAPLPGAPQTALLAALWEMGAITPEEMRIERVYRAEAQSDWIGSIF